MSGVPIINLPFLYINGLELANDATTPDEIITIASGRCRDSSDTYDMVLDSAVTVDNTLSGVGGLDQGTVAASTVYAVYLISDPVSANPTAGILSTSLTGPLMPFGYSAWRLIGYAVTDATSDFLLAYWAGNNNSRMMMYDAPQATAVTAGNETTNTAVDLSAFVPAIDLLPVHMAYAFTPGAASRTLDMLPGNGTGNAVRITGQVTSVVVSGNAMVLERVTSGVPEIDYKVANGGDAVALNVAGFEFYI